MEAAIAAEELAEAEYAAGYSPDDQAAAEAEVAQIEAAEVEEAGPAAPALPVPEAPETEPLGRVKDWLEHHTERFTAWGADPLPDHAGWRRSTLEGEVFYVLPKVWAAEVCAGLDHKAVVAALVARGWLRLDGEGKATKTRLPGTDRQVRAYVVRLP